MYNTGDKPGKGEYQCTLCGEIIMLKSDDDPLPPCPVCANTTFKKLS